MIHKLIARNSKDKESTWRGYTGEPGTQYKKWVYTSDTDFNKYGMSIIKRYSDEFDMEHYIKDKDDNWSLVDG